MTNIEHRTSNIEHRMGKNEETEEQVRGSALFGILECWNHGSMHGRQAFVLEITLNVEPWTAQPSYKLHVTKTDVTPKAAAFKGTISYPFVPDLGAACSRPYSGPICRRPGIPGPFPDSYRHIYGIYHQPQKRPRYREVVAGSRDACFTVGVICLSEQRDLCYRNDCRRNLYCSSDRKHFGLYA